MARTSTFLSGRVWFPALTIFFFNVSKVIRHGFHSREAKYHVVVTMSGSIFVASQFVLFLMSASLKKQVTNFYGWKVAQTFQTDQLIHLWNPYSYSWTITPWTSWDTVHEISINVMNFQIKFYPFRDVLHINWWAPGLFFLKHQRT